MEEKAQTLFQKGVDAYAKGNKEGALREFLKAAMAYPDFANAWFNAGVVYMEEERYDNAIASYECALAIDPNNIDAWNNLGVALHRDGNLDGAMKAHERARALASVETAPREYAIAEQNIAIIYSAYAREGNAKENFMRAIEAYDRAIAADVKKIDSVVYGKIQANRGDVFYWLSAAENAFDNLNEAWKSYAEAIDAFKDNDAFMDSYADAQFGLATVMRDLGYMNEDAQSITRAIEKYEAIAPLYTEMKRPERYALLMTALSDAYRALARLINEAGKANVKKAEEAENKSMRAREALLKK